MSNPFSTKTLTPPALALLLLLASSPASADAQLVHMTNGKTVRAESVEPQGDWLLVTLEGGGVIGVLADTVEQVEEDLFPESGELGSELNVVTSGRYVPRGRGSVGRSRSPQAAPAVSPPGATNTRKDTAKPGVQSPRGRRAQTAQPGTPSNTEGRRNR